MMWVVKHRVVRCRLAGLMVGLMVGCAMPGVAVAEVASLTDALANAYRLNPQLSASREALKARDEGVAQAVSGFRPRVTAEYDKGTRKTSSGTGPKRDLDTESRMLQLEQPIFSGGESYYGIQSADASVMAERQALRAQEQQTLLDAATAYVDVIRARKLLELSQKNVQVLGENLDATRQRFDVGEVTRTDTAQAEARAAQAESERVQAEADLVAAESTFERVVRDKPSETLVLEMPVLTLPEALEDAVALGLKENPNLQQSKFAATAADHTVKVRRAGLLPAVNLVASTQRDEGSSFGNDPYRNDVFQVRVTVPLYESGSVYSQVRQAKREASQRELLAEDNHNRVVELVSSAWKQLASSKSSIVSNREAIEAARTALEGVRQEQLYGARTTLDVLDAERELFQREVDLVTAERNEAVATFNLAALVGQFTAEGVKLPVELYDPELYYKNNKYKILGF